MNTISWMLWDITLLVGLFAMLFVFGLLIIGRIAQSNPPLNPRGSYSWDKETFPTPALARKNAPRLTPVINKRPPDLQA